ncbi:glycosyltransferase [Gordonia rhizosphera]|uniref:4,4'-diaponeurosporenoate glycosyltransferase n=1 Tax=Gordonia rhizosphera NBRC 16068 TaxID=1108045 RepID=K6WJL4_9ACTN|nr:glycosyltransferase family 2 protein [Gordonia rhizosphera]GAB92322.1 putative glycosyltransferase [Gordonia rhizosphera NBRC 16068]
MSISLSVVVPSRNAAATLDSVLDALKRQSVTPREIIVVDDASTDDTAAIAGRYDVRVVTTDHVGYAGGARNRGWDEATSQYVCFVDADACPDENFVAGVERAVSDFPKSVIGCARRFSPGSAWSWVAHLQCETPYLEIGIPRDAPFVSSFCMVVPADLPVRWDESYGGEDMVFSADVLAAGYRLIFDPRFHASHVKLRETYADLRRQQRRQAYGQARGAYLVEIGRARKVLARVPLHYFVLARLPVIYRRLGDFPELRAGFWSHLGHLIVGEWMLGISAWRYALRRPPVRGHHGPDTR